MHGEKIWGSIKTGTEGEQGNLVPEFGMLSFQGMQSIIQIATRCHTKLKSLLNVVESVFHTRMQFVVTDNIARRISGCLRKGFYAEHLN